jgi:hypothetical protein
MPHTISPSGGDRMRGLVVTLALWALGLVLVSPERCFCQVVSAEAAATRAAEFAALVGIPWGQPTSVTLAENVSECRLAEWQIDFHDFSSIGVDLRTGVVVSAVDYSAVQENALRQGSPELNEQEAMARASEIAACAGLAAAQQFDVPSITLQESSPGAYRFAIHWRRLFNRIPFQRDGTSVLLGASDGRFLALSAGLDTPPPTGTEVHVGKEAAQAAAVDCASRLGVYFEALDVEAELMIVMPNSYWSRWGLGDEVTTGRSRVAWVVSVTDQKGRDRIFWIDADDGALLGGTQSKNAIASRTPLSDSATAVSTRSITTPNTRAFILLLLGASALAAMLGIAGALLLRARRAATH